MGWWQDFWSRTSEKKPFVVVSNGSSLDSFVDKDAAIRRAERHKTWHMRANVYILDMMPTRPKIIYVAQGPERLGSNQA